MESGQASGQLPFPKRREQQAQLDVTCLSLAKGKKKKDPPTGNSRGFIWWKLVTSDVCQGSVLGLVLSNILINVSDSGTECIPSRFADDTKMSSAADTTEGSDAIQIDLVKLENWTYELHEV
ncbi:hypothetical protein DUI87_00681 [Hirundo rustica rustica]|uniref:Reverse transcriptase domain-containing protein n=1 Tax=Hirundo rustica rustica TaxID=333673 RepID=A0A3M0LA34_HIRRU|nr:hypothetical protein DUI87_00681 [Hirundo rustica rustica]